MRQDTNQDRTTRRSSNRVTVTEAARTLGVTVDAIRKRIQRGTIPHERHEDGRVYVLLDAARTMQDGDQYIGQDEYRTGDRTPPARDDELVEALREQIEYMRGELTTRNEELRRKDHIIAALTERIPELEPLKDDPLNHRSEPRDGPQTTSQASGGVEDQFSDRGPQDGSQRPWWKQLFRIGDGRRQPF